MQTILVIGASGGIGNSVAQVLLDAGYSVIGTYFQHPERIKNLEQQNNFKGYAVDLKSIELVKELQKQVCVDSTMLFAVINCSGIVQFEGKSLEKDIEIWHETIAVNLTGNYYLAKIFQPHISENGRFIMVSSTDSYFGGSITASYAASKGGVNSLTKSLSLLLQDKKIRVNAIAPGWVETPMTEVNGDAFLKKVAEINPLKRNAKPSDVAHLVKFLLSAEASFINGQVINLEGGYTNQDPTLLLEEEAQL